MPFRGHEHVPREFLRDPFPRFVAIEAALETNRSMFHDHVAQVFAALALVVVPGEPEAIAEALRETHEALSKPMFGPMTGFGPSLTQVFAASLLRHGDDVSAVIAECERVLELMKKHKLRKLRPWQLISILALRVLLRGAPIEDAHLARMREIYAAIKGHSWWKTGPEDLPACAMLTLSEGTPQELAARADAIYRGLEPDANLLTRGFAQDASNLLALAPVAPEILVDRIRALRAAFAAGGLSTLLFEDLASLSFIPRSPESIVAHVVELLARFDAHARWVDRLAAYTTRYAVNLAFIHLTGNQPELGPLADVKALRDMYTIVLSRG